jgi:cytochrome c oxidase subunit 1
VTLPRIRSERPAFDLHHPDVAELDAPTANKNVLDKLFGEPDIEGEGVESGPRGGVGGGNAHEKGEWF